MNCSCPSIVAEIGENKAGIVLHIILFVLAIFWPFMVIGLSMIGVKIKEDYLDAIELRKQDRLALAQESKTTYDFLLLWSYGSVEAFTNGAIQSRLRLTPGTTTTQAYGRTHTCPELRDHRTLVSGVGLVGCVG
jgi:hypothetical protein